MVVKETPDQNDHYLNFEYDDGKKLKRLKPALFGCLVALVKIKRGYYNITLVVPPFSSRIS